MLGVEASDAHEPDSFQLLVAQDVVPSTFGKAAADRASQSSADEPVEAIEVLLVAPGIVDVFEVPMPAARVIVQASNHPLDSLVAREVRDRTAFGFDPFLACVPWSSIPHLGVEPHPGLVADYLAGKATPGFWFTEVMEPQKVKALIECRDVGLLWVQLQLGGEPGPDGPVPGLPRTALVSW